MPIDYSKWKDIEVSDDEDDTHPNVDTPSLFRWRHDARLQRMGEKAAARSEVELGLTDTARKIKELEARMAAATIDTERTELKVKVEELRKQEAEWKAKEDELAKKERLEPWNVDTIGHEGFTKSRVNKVLPAKKETLSDEEKEERMRKFFDAHEKEMEAFGMLRKWEDSKAYLLEHRHLCSDHTASYLTIHCLNLEMKGKHDLMCHVAHQCIVMQYLVELASQLDRCPEDPNLIQSFFHKIAKAEASYLQMFEDELSGFRKRIADRAKVKLAEAQAEAEEEERKQRLGPGGLDPQEVFPTLPQEMQDCFEKQDIPALQKLAETMDKATFAQHLQRCIDSGLWVPNAKDAEEAEATGESKTEEEEFDEPMEPKASTSS